MEDRKPQELPTRNHLGTGSKPVPHSQAVLQKLICVQGHSSARHFAQHVFLFAQYPATQKGREDRREGGGRKEEGGQEAGKEGGQAHRQTGRPKSIM